MTSSLESVHDLGCYGSVLAWFSKVSKCILIASIRQSCSSAILSVPQGSSGVPMLLSLHLIMTFHITSMLMTPSSTFPPLNCHPIPPLTARLIFHLHGHLKLSMAKPKPTFPHKPS